MRQIGPVILAFAIGSASLVAAAHATGGLRGTSASVTAARTSAPPAPATPQGFLSAGVWRAGACSPDGNFQRFVFSGSSAVEVGSGRPGEGERLEVVRVGRSGDLVEVETRVCAPVGCNQTFEQYKVLGQDRIQEWRFEGRLPDQPPYILVRDGQALDGSGPGRTFQRCQS